MVFNHSVKVPTQYKRIASVLKGAFHTKKSLKYLIYEEKHARVPGMQAVLKKYFDNRADIDRAIEETKIVEDNPRLCPFLCKALVTELIYGRKELKGDSKPVETVRSYRQQLLDALSGKESLVAEEKAPNPRYVRINTNLISISEAFEMLASENWRKKECPPFESYTDYLNAIGALEEDEYLVDMHVEDLLVFHSKQKQYWACHQFAKEKKFMLQDKGTCLVAELLRPPPDAIVLDMCAAPGMKTIHISNVMQNKGTIFAVDNSLERFHLLQKMTDSAGCKNVKAIHSDALKFDDDTVEYVLVDPSCTGSGIQNRLTVHSEEKNPERLKKLSYLQSKMLSHAMTAFPAVKRIAYSTCSLYEEENEQVVQHCLELHPEFKLLSGKKALRNKWTNVGNTKYKNIGKKCIYTIPEKDLTSGFFVAIFEKRQDADNNAGDD